MERPNRHHIMYERPDWCANKESRYLRQTRLLIPRTEREAHDELHTDPETRVPILGAHALRLIVREFRPAQNTFMTMDNIMMAIEYANKHHSSFNSERDLGQRAIHAIERQKIYLMGNIIKP
jgi:hypothetical protein